MAGGVHRRRDLFTYKANDDGQMVALRAYWEMDRAIANTKKI
jgi:hypothetical protein